MRRTWVIVAAAVVVLGAAAAVLASAVAQDPDPPHRLWLSHVEGTPFAPPAEMTADPGAPAEYVGEAPFAVVVAGPVGAARPSWAVHRRPSAVVAWLQGAQILRRSPTVGYLPTSLCFHDGGRVWYELTRTDLGSVAPPDADDVAGTWNVTIDGVPAVFDLRADGTVERLGQPVRWTRWRSHLCVGAAGGRRTHADRDRDAFDATLAPDLRTFKGTDAGGRTVEGRRADGAR